MSVDRYKAMEVFTRVVELGSFSRAAAALHMPRARVTTVIQELESHLGTRLLNRTTRRVSVTDDGAVYHQRALALVQDIDELEGVLKRASTKPVGRLRVDVPAAVGRHVLAPALPAFAQRHPGIALELGSTDHPLDLIAEGVDCMIRGGLVYDESLVAKPLGRMPVVTCAAPQYLERYGEPKRLDDLERHRFVNFFSAKTGRVFPFDFAKGEELRQVSRPHHVAANDADTYIAAGLAGMGLMQIPCSRQVREHLAAGRLQRVLADWTADPLPMVLLYPRNRHLSTKVRSFVEWAVEVFAGEFEPIPG